MKQAIDALNALVAQHVIGKYAVGGAIAALQYLEPAFTNDLDILISFEQTKSGLVSLRPIYDALAELGYGETRNEGVVIGGWTVQFIPVADTLDAEALEQAEEMPFSGTRVRILRAEHVVATSLRVGRPKDWGRIDQFIEQKKVDLRRLAGVLERHELKQKWDEFCLRFGLKNPFG